MVADEPPVATVLPSDRPDIVGVGVPEPPRTGGELTTSLQPGREVRPSGLTPPAPGEVSFFGATDTGQSVVFVLDCSSSMARHNAIGVAKSELKASLNQLGRDQKFQIVFYNNTPNIIRLRDVEESELLLATAINRNFAVQFIDSQNATSGTNHMPALKWALHFNPDMIFLLTDADEPVLKPRDFAEIRKLNKAKTRIHCIEFGEYADLSRDKNFLKELAREQRGTYRYYDVTRFSQR